MVLPPDYDRPTRSVRLRLRGKVSLGLTLRLGVCAPGDGGDARTGLYFAGDALIRPFGLIFHLADAPTDAPSYPQTPYDE